VSAVATFPARADRDFDSGGIAPWWAPLLGCFLFLVLLGGLTILPILWFIGVAPEDFWPWRPPHAEAFQPMAAERARVVQSLAATGPDEPRPVNGCGSNVQLPDADRQPSALRRVLFLREAGVVSIYFFTRGRVFGDGEGFLYRSDGTPPPDRLFGCTGRIGIIGPSAEPVADHWFWASYGGLD
jgi:hypothetical protein